MEGCGSWELRYGVIRSEVRQWCGCVKMHSRRQFGG